MIPNLLRYKTSQRFLVWDYETEGLNLALLNKPWQCGYAVCEGERILEVVNDYIWWDDLNISVDAAKITKFDRAKYDRLAKPAGPILEKFESYLFNPEYIVLGHNTNNFDIYMHQLYRKKLGLPVDYSFLHRSIDTNALFKMYKLGIKTFDSSKGYYAECVKFSNYIEKGLKSSLSTAAKELSVDYREEDLHDAEKDTIINFAVWNKLKWVIEI